MIEKELLKMKAQYMADMSVSELQVEKGYRIALDKAMKKTADEIENKTMDKGKYFESVTRALYYMGYFDREKLMADEIKAKMEAEKKKP